MWSPCLSSDDPHGYVKALADLYKDAAVARLHPSPHPRDKGQWAISRDRLDLLIGHALMSRGESTQKLPPPDLFSMELQNEGPTPCIAAMVIMDQGKINQFRRIEYGRFIRHREVELLSILALALYLFWRFHIVGEVFPDLTSRQNWYNTHLIDGKDPKGELSVSTQAGGLKKAMQECGER